MAERPELYSKNTLLYLKKSFDTHVASQRKKADKSKTQDREDKDQVRKHSRDQEYHKH